MKLFKKKEQTSEQLNKELNTLLGITDEDKIDINSMDVVVERVEAGLIGTYKVLDDINYPLFKIGDYLHIRVPSKLAIKDFVLYKVQDEYAIRRIIRYNEDDIFVAGDNEDSLRIIQKDNIIGKVIARQRNNKHKNLALNPPSRLYTISKVNLSYFRFKDRILQTEDIENLESLEQASKAASQVKIDDEVLALTGYIQSSDLSSKNAELDEALSSFIDPDSLVLALQAQNEEKNIQTMTDEDIERELNMLYEQQATDDQQNTINDSEDLQITQELDELEIDEALSNIPEKQKE